MRIAMFGGTFNPPHLGHMAAAKACVETLQLDKLLLMPDNIPPHKILPEGSATPQQRLQMCRIAASKIPNCEACDLELRRTGPSYTVDTVTELAQRYPDSQLWLIVGTDMILSFDRWREPEKIGSLCRLAVVARNEEDRKAITKKSAQLRQTLGLGIDLIDNVAFPASSTEVRANIADAPLDPDVAAYITEQLLYLPSPETLRAAVEKRVSPKRFAHTLGCERLAVQMAKKYGVQESLIRTAAILHDCTKALSDEEQLTLCKKWNIITDYGEEHFSQLIHADTGAETAVREFHMPETVAEVIRTHTVGAPEMSDAQKILYVADLCEETRTYEGAERLRALALEDLELAYTEGLKRTVAFLREQGKEPYYVTVQALNARNITSETEDKI